MNERIIELVKQAGGHWNYGDRNLPNVVEFQETDIPKFVELIVLECSEYVKDCGMQPSVFTAADLLERFGVKISIPLGEEHER